MEAKNFRIGNKIMFGERWINISHHDISNMAKMEVTEGEISSLYKPIELTADWLIKFGFKEGNKCYKNAYSLDVLKTDFYLRPSYEDGFYWGFNISDEKLDCELNDVKPLKYVHELQNLFFAITGTELRLKDECSTCG